MIFESGDVYEGQFDEGIPHGQGQFTYASGDVETAEWDKGQGDYNFFENLGSFSVGWDRSQEVIKIFEPFLYCKKIYGNLVKLLADWCWQSEVGQIGWFSMRFPQIFYNIKMAKKIL